MAERTKATVLKTVRGASPSRVRIPVPPHSTDGFDPGPCTAGVESAASALCSADEAGLLAMTVVLGVEGGGSHTHAVVADAEGRVLGAGGSDDPSNWEDVGIGAASAAIRAVVREALDGARRHPGDVEAAVFGLAGVDFPIDEQRLSGIPDAIGLTGRTSILNDGFVAMRAGTDDRFGVVVVAGTGSVVAGRNPAGEVFRTLGM